MLEFNISIWPVPIMINKKTEMSRIMIKLDFCICKNKGGDQLYSQRVADQHLCFRYIERTIPLLPKYEISSLQPFLAHLSRRLRGELIVYRSSRRPSVRACVHPSVCTLSNMNISETNGSIATKFYLKQHWGGGLAA